jgi:hypothetical protein
MGRGAIVAKWRLPRVRERLWRLRIVLACVAGVLLVAMLCALVAATLRPRDYTPASIDYNQLRADRSALARLQDRISTALNSGRDIRVELTEAQIDRWLAARNEIWPQAATGFDRWQDPLITIHDNDLRITVTVAANGWRFVLRLAGRVAVSPESLTVEITAAAIGRLPLPPTALVAALERWVQPPAAVLRRGATFTFPNHWTWANGRKPFVLTELQATNGQVSATLAPLAAER